MIRVHQRIGRHTSISTPFWLAALAYVFIGAAIAALALVVAAITAAVVLVLGVLALCAAIVGRLRQRRTPRK
jgi:Flp pilus assembly protein TadB